MCERLDYHIETNTMFQRGCLARIAELQGRITHARQHPEDRMSTYYLPTNEALLEQEQRGLEAHTHNIEYYTEMKRKHLIAFTMGGHRRLGEHSVMNRLDNNIINMICRILEPRPVEQPASHPSGSQSSDTS